MDRHSYSTDSSGCEYHNILIPALLDGNRDYIQAIINKAVSNNTIESLLEERNNLKESPIICAIKLRFTDIAEKLIRLDNNVNYQVPIPEKTALMYACERKQLSVIKCLSEHGASSAIKDWKNKTAHDYCCDLDTKQALKNYFNPFTKSALQDVTISQIQELIGDHNF